MIHLATEKKKCFIIIPFSDPDKTNEGKWYRIFDFIRECVETASGLSYDVFRSDAKTGSITDEIIRNLDTADLVIADCTNKNGNVFYELGIRHCRRIGTILIAQDRNDFPFDLHGEANHIYNYQSAEGKTSFINKLKELIKYVESNPNKPDSRVGELLSYSVAARKSIDGERIKIIGEKINLLENNERDALQYMLVENLPVSNKDLIEKFGVPPDRIREMVKNLGLIQETFGRGGTFPYNNSNMVVRFYEIHPNLKSQMEQHFDLYNNSEE